MATVVNNPDESRYEIFVDGHRASLAAYRVDGDDVLVFTHTEIDEVYEGHGLGGQLAEGALDGVRAEGLKVVAQCPFIKGWIERFVGCRACRPRAFP